MPIKQRHLLPNRMHQKGYAIKSKQNNKKAWTLILIEIELSYAAIWNCIQEEDIDLNRTVVKHSYWAMIMVTNML